MKHPDFFFECEFGIDTRNLVGDISVPKKKVQELKLKEVRREPIETGSAGDDEAIFYEPVIVELQDDNGQWHKFGAEPFVTPYGNTLYPDAPSIPAGTPAPHGPVFPLQQISPVKLPIPNDRNDIDSPTIGAPAIRRFGLGLDTKNHCLYSVVRRI